METVSARLRQRRLSDRYARQQILTLILQGGGNSCTSGVDFTHWTLVMQGPKASYTLYGNLVR
ncbi:hypothetical protein JQ634_17720 [Bradyrhizobium sp. AUGA SZCCT0240]|jgi:hypothetical protein|uniref:hypothetical protein n=1 Tax=unclassified Bradyrhizobium TaxID=2631580 RepID=UPI001BA50CA1|nr:MULTISPECIES: hypothetical protein [unclassified Bradyrhizobium]MBR1198611.1 hypothetical protein [Bradyrhizobium sp. AUGA SZCCT0158]MBR1239584.1 hypothetical protein [Bradyrhizobium sp. AUGA SZCCT0274]MBR1255539.1 hypothetical protein [Bradyrhizobium sp. AUGA SZCCT0240]